MALHDVFSYLFRTGYQLAARSNYSSTRFQSQLSYFQISNSCESDALAGYCSLFDDGFRLCAGLRREAGADRYVESVGARH